MPNEYQKDGDIGFVGLNSRDNPSSLPAGIVSQSQNFRLDRGVATVRKGLQRKTIGALISQTIYGVGTYINSSGQEIIIAVVTNGLYSYNPQSETLSAKVNFPAGETITTQDGCDVVTAVDNVYISRGWSKRPLVWDLNVTITALPVSPSSGHKFPNCTGMLYYANRMIVLGKYHAETNTLRNYDTISVSNFLDFQEWDALDAFTINNGSNDQVVGVAPWTLNEFLVFMRNSIFYINTGGDRYVSGDGLSATSYIKTLATDIGCSARKSVVQAGGGVFFLSDNGIYFLQPQPASAESMKLLTMADPISSPIDDVIQRINRTYAHRAVATYWNNRYYLAVPLDSSVDNNAILVYNFILKQWESVDIYPSGFDVFDFIVAKKDNQRRLYGVDTDQGLFLMEELNWDEYQNWAVGDPNSGKPTLPFYLPATLEALSFPANPINSILKTRRYSFNSIGDKRFSTAEVELVADAGSQVVTTAEVYNPDIVSVIDTFGSEFTEDSARRNGVRKIGTGIQLQFTTNNLRPSIRSAYIYATVQKQTNQSKQ
jgi:hypothetical protein